MEITQKKQPSEVQGLAQYVESIQYKDYPMQLLGTGGLKAMTYYSDFDFFTQIEGNTIPINAFLEFVLILFRTLNINNVFFQEFKIQNINGEKFKFERIRDFNKIDFDKHFSQDTDYCKIDFIINMNTKFIDLSVIYRFNQAAFDKEAFQKSLKEDYADMLKEKKYFKSLKRRFALLKSEGGHEDELVEMADLFNSETGKLYQLNSNLKCIVDLLDKHNNEMIRKKVTTNLQSLGFIDFPISKIKPLIKVYDKIINREGFKYLKHKKLI